MKKITVIFLGLILTQACLSQTGTITGLVYDNDTAKGIEFVHVTLGKVFKEHVTLKKGKVFTNTDSVGKFRLENISPGKYSIRFGLVGYGDTTVTNVEVKPDTTIELKINLFVCEYLTIGGRETCPICNQNDSIIPIVYGKPSKKIIKRAQKGEIKIGRSYTTHCDPYRYCVRDNHKF